MVTVFVAYNNCSSYQNQSGQSSQGCTNPGYVGPTLMVNNQPAPAGSAVPIIVGVGSAIQFAVAAPTGGIQPCAPTDGNTYWILPDQTKVPNYCVLQTINIPGQFPYTFHISQNLGTSGACPNTVTDTRISVQVQ